MTSTARTAPKTAVEGRNERGQFILGHTGLGGRPRGSRNKLGEQFIEDLYLHWQANGAAVIERVCQERPQDYLKVVASILPKEVHAKKDTSFEDMTDEELLDTLATVRAFMATAGGAADDEMAH